MKRILFILMLLLVLAACGNETPDNTEDVVTDDENVTQESSSEFGTEKKQESAETEDTDEETDEVDEGEAESGEDQEDDKNDNQLEGEANAEEHPATPGKKLYDEEFIGMNYYFKGELVRIEKVEGLFGEMEDAFLVENEQGFVLVIFPPYEMSATVGDKVEAWGPLSGDGYTSSDLGVDNVVGVTGAMNAGRVNINGEIQ
ncbi:hypothetical protein JNUCC74_11195 [Cerasibacillus sp. JNUCC 74]